MFVGGIAGLIISSVAGNNVGVVVTIGMITAVAAIVLLAVSAVGHRQRIDAFEEADAERFESQIVSLVDAGTDEQALRSLVRDAMRRGRS